VTYVPNELLSRLVGCRLYSVQFVIDLVYLSFDSAASDETPAIRCDNPAVVQTATARLRDGDAGYADALRSIIEDHVIRTFEAPRQGLRIDFASASLTLRPTKDELVSPEIAMLTGFKDGREMLWLVGENSFEYLR
jgi:hypothetical protein